MHTGFAIAIMAAGRGTRLKSRRPKVLHEVGGKSLLLHVIAAASTIVPPSDILCIVGHEAKQVESAVASTGVRFVLQAEQRGTGHAVQQVKSWYAATGIPLPENLLILSGDVPLIRPETLASICEAHAREQAAMTILTAVPSDPTGYGRILRENPDRPEVLAIVEQKQLAPDQLATPEINSGIYCFRTESLFAKLDGLSDNNVQGEFYLTDVASALVSAGERVIAVQVPEVDEVLGANTIAEMMHLDASMRASTARKLMAAGVTIFRPDTCVIDASVSVGPDTIIEPFVQLLGDTHVGPECRIRSYSVVQSSTLGTGVLVRNGCVLDRAIVEDQAVLGPYAHLRPESHIGASAHVGNFVETKNIRLGRGSKANHLNYLGDAVIGEGVNIGAGAITCNYDGVNKHQTTIGNHVFIGSDSALVAPVTIAAGSYVAAGSCITEDVPAGALAFGRARQVNKAEWATRKAAERATTIKSD